MTANEHDHDAPDVPNVIANVVTTVGILAETLAVVMAMCTVLIKRFGVTNDEFGTELRVAQRFMGLLPPSEEAPTATESPTDDDTKEAS